MTYLEYMTCSIFTAARRFAYREGSMNISNCTFLFVCNPPKKLDNFFETQQNSSWGAFNGELSTIICTLSNVFNLLTSSIAVWDMELGLAN